MDTDIWISYHLHMPWSSILVLFFFFFPPFKHRIPFLAHTSHRNRWQLDLTHGLQFAGPSLIIACPTLSSFPIIYIPIKLNNLLFSQQFNCHLLQEDFLNCTAESVLFFSLSLSDVLSAPVYWLKFFLPCTIHSICHMFSLLLWYGTRFWGKKETIIWGTKAHLRKEFQSSVRTQSWEIQGGKIL